LDYSQELLGDIRALIESARQRATAMVNSELTLLFWRIGRRIHTEVLAGERAGYGEQIVPAVSAQLTRDYGDGFAEKSLRRMVQFAAIFPEEPIVATLSRQLSWSHFVLLLPLKDPSGNIIPRCAALNAGACVPCADASLRCCTSARHCLGSRTH